MIRKLWMCILGNVVLGVSTYILAGMLPVVAHDLGTDAATVGWGITVFTAGYAVAGPILAGRVERAGRRGLVAVYVLFVVATLATAMSLTVGQFCVSRLLAGLAAGIFSPITSSLAVASVPSDRAGRALAWMLGGLVGGSVFGVPLGLLLTQQAGWRRTFVVLGIAGVVVVFGLLTLRFGAAEALSTQPPWRLLKSRLTLLTLTVTFLTAMSSLGLYAFVVPMLQGTDLESTTTLAIWMWGAGGALGVLLIGRLVDAVPSSLVLTLGILAVCGLALAMLATSRSLPVILAAMLIWGCVGWASLAPQQKTLIFRNPHERSAVVALNSSANYIGSTCGTGLGALAVGQGAVGVTLPRLALIPLALALLAQLLRARFR